MLSFRYQASALLAWSMLLLVSNGASAQPLPVGFVKVASGATSVLRSGQAQAIAVGDPVLEGDTLQTGTKARLGLTLRDDTRISLGPDSQLAISSFAFAPAEGRLGLVLRLARGVLDYVSGKLATLAPGAIRIETPATVIGVRGTHLLIGAAQ